MKRLLWIGGLCIVLLVAGMICISPATALKNPAAVYAHALGYDYVLVEEKGLGVRGMVKLPDGTEVSGWDFLKGKEGSEYSVCALLGGTLQTVQDRDACSPIFSDTCAICEFSNGTKAEVTVLMNLDFSETECGDGRCGTPENSQTCPKDCPKGGMDEYCDGGYNDPDCDTEKNTTPDKKE